MIIGDVLYKYKPINEEGSEPVCEIPEGVKEIFASTYCEFETIPTSEEIRGIITQTVDLMDNENFRSSIYTLLSI